MEAQQQQGITGANEDGGSGKSSYLCRQSSTRWTPTTDQIRILKELYYNNGVRSPSADQIQRISARLRQYGKIEGKNVFYWFQNHKARERQKKRFVVPSSAPAPPATNASSNAAAAAATDVSAMRQSGYVSVPSHGAWKTEDSASVQSKYPCSYTAPGFPCPSPSSSSSLCPNVVPVGHMVGGFGYGAVAMEKNFRECSISAGGNGHNFQWAAPNPPSYYFFDKKSSTIIIDESLDDDDDEEEEEEDQQDDHEIPELETLPLFPMHGEDSPVTTASFRETSFRSEPYYGGSCHWSHGGGGDGSRASLELSLNSFPAGNSINF
ncbi:hypothetical protein Dimus_017362 [Dionaea muscipula]